MLPPAAPAPTPPPDPPPRYFVASVDTSSTSAAASEDGLKILDDRGKQALRPGITVAFFPPDQCRNIAAATTSATPEAAEMANNCGVLISALETSVADRYSVVSWQTLKGSDPFARAESRKVDVIFEVDSFGMNALGQDAASQMRIDFHEQTTATDRTPLTLGPSELPAIASRCKVGVDQMQKSRLKAGMVGSFTGAIKAVEVSTGKALVYYQRTLTDTPDKKAEDGFDLYFESRGRQDWTPPPTVPRTHNGLQKGGAALAILGGAMVVIGGVLRFVAFPPSNVGFNNKGTAASAGVFLTGFFVAGGGITMLILGNRKAKRTVPPTTSDTPLPPPTYQSPSEVICVSPTTPPWLAGPKWEGPAEQEAQGGSSYSFSETQSAGRDGARERENRLRKLVIDDFTRELSSLGK